MSEEGKNIKVLVFSPLYTRFCRVTLLLYTIFCSPVSSHGVTFHKSD